MGKFVWNHDSFGWRYMIRFEPWGGFQIYWCWITFKRVDSYVSLRKWATKLCALETDKVCNEVNGHAEEK